MNVILTVIAAILVFCFLILSHEFGHFIVAKACHVYVEDFSLGMGPKICSWQGRETQYTLRCLPIGGWCRMLGEDEDVADARAFCSRPVWQRICIVAAGPVMNFVCAFIIFVIVYMMIGTASNVNQIGGVVDDSPAAVAGLQAGDVIYRIDDQEITAWPQIAAAVVTATADGATTLPIYVHRGDEDLMFLVEPSYNEEYGVYQLGVTATIAHQNLFTALGLGVRESIYFIGAILHALAAMISGQMALDVSGPVGIVTVISQATGYGMRSLLLLTAYLCINLGLFNLFPLPALDGSRIVFLGVEALRGKPIDRKKEGLVHFIGLILLMGLMVVITFADIARLVS